MLTRTVAPFFVVLLLIDDEIGYDAEDIDRDNIAARLKQDAVSVCMVLYRTGALDGE